MANKKKPNGNPDSLWQKELDHWEKFLEQSGLELDGDHHYKEQIDAIKAELEKEKKRSRWRQLTINF